MYLQTNLHRTARLVTAAAAALLLAGAGCGDLTVAPKSTITSGNIFDDPSSYRSFLAKLYGGLSLTGQSGPDGSADIQGIDEGFSQYLRGYWQLQELPTDEAIIGWGDIGLPELNSQLWSASNPFVLAMYSRIFYQVALANQFLRETTDEKLAGRSNVTADLRTQIQQYRAEARFLRALSYYHAIDLFGNVPLVDENFDLTALPEQGTRAEVFAFVESEFRAIRTQLPATSRGANYGRASQGAVDMVLAKLYLNAQVYTGTARWADARTAAEAVINANNYSLDPNFLRLFSIDNTASQEIIFQVPFDGVRTRTWGGMTYLVHAAVGDGMNAADYGIDGGWFGLRLRPPAVDRYQAGDTRSAYFHTEGRTKSITAVGTSRAGYAAPKFRNRTTAGQVGSHLTFPDTDFPMFRLADAYLMYAEAVLRGGGGSRATALDYVNQIRRRAYGGAAGNITDAQLTLDFILDERSRELLWEAHRRQDLIRFGRFSSAGVWEWKGGVQAGRTTEAFRDLFPIPANELSANPNIKQNTGY
jgi:starch-binding outer membrane protein, SusD/RagB family